MVTAKVDDDIMDEAAGRARLSMAAASKERRQREAYEQAKRASSHREMLQNTGVRTDDDIMDEEAGRARLIMAAQSRDRKAKEASELARQNAIMKDKLKSIKAVTDISNLIKSKF